MEEESRCRKGRRAFAPGPSFKMQVHNEAIITHFQAFNRAGLTVGVRERGMRIWLTVHCLSALPDRCPYCHANATSHSLLKDDQLACGDRLPVQCRCLRQVRHRIAIRLPRKCRYPLFAYLCSNLPNVRDSKFCFPCFRWAEIGMLVCTTLFEVIQLRFAMLVAQTSLHQDSKSRGGRQDNNWHS